MTLVRTLQKIINHQGKGSTFDRLVRHVKVISAEPGKIQCEMKVKEEHLNKNGSLHGGMTCALVDILTTYAIGTTKENKFGVSVDLNVSFLSAVQEGETITIKSEVLKTGKNLAFATSDFLNENGKTIASGRHTKFL